MYKRNAATDKSRPSFHSSENGFTILEVIVAMTIFLIVTGSIWGLMRVALQSRSVVNQRVQLAKNVRLGLNLIGRDTYNAGYGYPLKNTVVLSDNRLSTKLGVATDVDTSRDTVPPVIAGNNITVDNFNTVANTKTDQVTFMFKDTSFNLVGGVSQPLNINAATTNGSGIDEIVPISGSNSSCAVNDLFLITGASGSTIGVVTALSGTNILQFSNGDVLGFNLSGTSGPLRSITTPASLTRIKMVTYFVASDGTLTRREFANAPTASMTSGYIDEPLVYGVEDFQIKYIMDDGSLSDNPSAGADGIAGNADDDQTALMAVRQVRFTISVRSVEKDQQGNYFRETLTSTYATRNMGYDAN